MAQNVYEQENFFKEYIQLPCQVKGLDGTPEWPALKALIPDPKGSTFLDLGCGFGWISQWAQENGAIDVEISENMLSKAGGFPPDEPSSTPKPTWRPSNCPQTHTTPRSALSPSITSRIFRI
ncbi:hypothetical protein BDZ45DRAFT_796979 [Acephala macrosclerotiorum]|nr:hypothetical protein BDZ45DRAFT_796979 [Acephala macrosclerotiorum]